VYGDNVTSLATDSVATHASRLVSSLDFPVFSSSGVIIKPTKTGPRDRYRYQARPSGAGIF